MQVLQRHFFPQIACHIEDIPENGADVNHLGAVHRVSIFGGGEPSSWAEWLTSWAWHEWGVTWKPAASAAEGEEDGGEEERHKAVVELRHDMKILGNVNLFSLDVSTE